MDNSSERSTRKDEDSISPPTYRVVEDELGDLLNPELKVKYPERPKKGRYSLTNYLRSRKKSKSKKKTKKRTYSDDESTQSKKEKRQSVSKSTKKSTSKSRAECRCKCGRCCCQESARRPRRDHREHRRQSKSKSYAKIPPAISLDALISERNKGKSSDDDEEEYDEVDQSRQSTRRSKASTFSPKVDLSSLSLREQKYKHNRMTITEPLKEFVVGPLTARVVAEMLAPTQFLLYYRRADLIDTIDDVPISEPLTMAYKSSDNRIFHYKLRYVNRDGKKFWHVDLGPGRKKQREFHTLERLIQYYKEFRTLSGDAL